MRLQTIRVAIKAKLGGLTRKPTVFAYGAEDRSGHNITILPGDPYVVVETQGQNYEAALYFDLRIEVPGRLDDSQIAMDDYLSTGAGSTSSVVDAILADGTIGGTVEDTLFLGVDGPNLEIDPITAIVHFRFMTSRG